MSQDTVRYTLSFINCLKKNKKQLIFEQCKSTHPPTILHWKREMSYYLNVEKTVAIEL